MRTDGGAAANTRESRYRGGNGPCRDGATFPHRSDRGLRRCGPARKTSPPLVPTIQPGLLPPYGDSRLPIVFRKDCKARPGNHGLPSAYSGISSADCSVRKSVTVRCGYSRLPSGCHRFSLIVREPAPTRPLGPACVSFRSSRPAKCEHGRTSALLADEFGQRRRPVHFLLEPTTDAPLVRCEPTHAIHISATRYGRDPPRRARPNYLSRSRPQSCG